MSVRTMPKDGAFNFKCAHCNFDFGSKPIKYIGEKDLHLQYCGQCHEQTLISNNQETVIIYKVES